jgi:hypothetical protein
MHVNGYHRRSIFSRKTEGKVRLMILLATASLLGLTGCVTKFVDESCQNRGYSPGSAQYDACYPSAAVAIAKTYGGAIQTGLQWPFVQPPPPPAR